MLDYVIGWNEPAGRGHPRLFDNLISTQRAEEGASWQNGAQRISTR